MPLVAIPVALPAEVVAVHTGDVDQDGVDDVIFVSAHRVPRKPDAITLTAVRVGDSGHPETIATVPLGRESALWDAGPGLVALTDAGVVDLLQPGAAPLPAPTALALLGVGTPAQADILVDLDGDGSGEVIFHDGRALRVLERTTGTTHTLKTPAEGRVQTASEPGGQRVTLAVAWPRIVTTDVDGDGLLDVVALQGDQAHALLTRTTGTPERRTLALPVDLAPRRDPASPPDADRRPVQGAWLDDVDGDGIADLVVHRAVVEGSWFGASAELIYARGTGRGFTTPQILTTDDAAVEVQLADLDGDGDQDLVVPHIDVSLSSFARAMLARRMQVEVDRYTFDSGYRLTPERVHTLSVPFENSESVHVKLTDDITGDGLADVVVQEGDSPLQVLAGTTQGVSKTPWATAAVEVPPGDESLLVADLTGDGRPELLVWGPGLSQGQLLIVRD